MVNENQIALKIPMLNNTLMGVISLIKRIFDNVKVDGKEITILPVTRPEALELAVQEQSVAKGSGKAVYAYPILGINITNISPGPGYNHNVLNRIGSKLGVSDDGHYFYMFRCTPKRIGYQLSFLSNDQQSVLSLIDLWLSNSRWKFELRLDSTGGRIPVTVTAETDVTVPLRTQNGANAENFLFTTNLTADSYVGTLWKIPIAARMQLQTVMANNVSDIEKGIAELGLPISIKEYILDDPNAIVGIHRVSE